MINNPEEYAKLYQFDNPEAQIQLHIYLFVQKFPLALNVFTEKDTLRLLCRMN